jgi:hypothetical protein
MEFVTEENKSQRNSFNKPSVDGKPFPKMNPTSTEDSKDKSDNKKASKNR